MYQIHSLLKAGIQCHAGSDLLRPIMTPLTYNLINMFLNVFFSFSKWELRGSWKAISILYEIVAL